MTDAEIEFDRILDRAHRAHAEIELFEPGTLAREEALRAHAEACLEIRPAAVAAGLAYD